jgi:hypothetical protein
MGKFMLIACLFCSTVAMASGELVSELYYLNDSQNFQASPYFGFKGDLKIENILLVGEFGGGYIDPGAGANGSYSHAAGDVYYLAKSNWKYGIGAGVQSNPGLFKPFEDYAHISASYKLW